MWPWLKPFNYRPNIRRRIHYIAPQRRSTIIIKSFLSSLHTASCQSPILPLSSSDAFQTATGAIMVSVRSRATVSVCPVTSRVITARVWPSVTTAPMVSASFQTNVNAMPATSSSEMALRGNSASQCAREDVPMDAVSRQINAFVMRGLAWPQPESVFRFRDVQKDTRSLRKVMKPPSSVGLSVVNHASRERV